MGSMRFLIYAVQFFACVAILHADGGRVLAQKEIGDYKAILFAEPTPLRAGMADLSLFLENRVSGEPVLNAVVTFRLIKLSKPTPELAWRGVGCVSPGQEVSARQGHSGNGLLYSAVLGIPEPGLWEVGVSISHAGESVRVPFEIRVEPARSPLATWWPFVAMVPAGILLYIWRGFLLKNRSHR